MTALSANRVRHPAQTSNIILGEITGADSDEFYEGAIVCHNASGKIAVGADTANFLIAGICSKRITTGSSNTTKIPFEFGHIERLENNGNITANHQGQSAYLVDDQTVGLAADVTNNVVVGRIVEVDSDGVWVLIGVYN